MNSRKKIIFMGTPKIASIYLQSLIESNFNIVAVFTQPPRKKGRGMQIHESSVQKLAFKNFIKVFHPTELLSKEIQKEFVDLQPDIIIVMGYGLILPKFILELPSFGCINIHLSLLPRWRGASPIEHTLIHGDKKTGVSIFKLISELDAGPILEKSIISINESLNKDDLENLLNIQGIETLKRLIPKIFNKTVNLEEQEESKVIYANKITPIMRKLNFNKEAVKVYNTIRAFSQKPGSWFILNKERIKIIKASYEIGDYQPSIIINELFHIGCLKGKICPLVLQREGKKAMKINEFLRGYKFVIGTKVNDKI